MKYNNNNGRVEMLAFISNIEHKKKKNKMRIRKLCRIRNKWKEDEEEGAKS